MRADTELFKDKIEISLDGRQVFYLFFGGAVIASLVFVLGVMVGRRVEARTHVDARPATSAVVDPLAALDELARRPRAVNSDDLAFPGALTADSDEPLGRVDRVLAAAVPAAVGGSAKPDRSSAGSRSQASKPERAKPAPAKPAAPPARADDGHDDEPAQRSARAGESSKPAEPAEDDKPKPAQDDKPKSAKFTLQLNSFQDRAEADSFYDKLRQAGYQPYVMETEVDDATWYRVRLGRYADYDDAIAAKKAFEDSQHIIAYVTRLPKE
ncbi:SPOR domain-containing protein [Haliangium sp.]|uniref:SPOR domain-containing protein n=1 Tax=Haliangium sp. TaxID=2663208 RepID=UPI003D0C8A83